MASQSLILPSNPCSARRPSFSRRPYFPGKSLNFALKPRSPPLWASRLHLISPRVVSVARRLPYFPDGSSTEKLPRAAFVFGGSGSGNGTRRANFILHFGFTHLNSGDLLRVETQSVDGIGTLIQNMMEEGRIVPAEGSIKLLQKATWESGNGKFFLDGFPLNEESCAAFEAIVLKGREDEIRKRFEAFLESSLPVIEHYGSRGNVRRIDAGKPIEEGFEAVKTVFTSKAEKPYRMSGGLSTMLPSLAAVQSVSKLVPVPPPSREDGAPGRVVALVIGAGGREHALCFALQRSPSCKAVFCAPGNAGISISKNAVCLPKLDISDSSAVISVCRKLGVDLVVVGSEVPLVSGIVDDLARAGILTFGPTSKAAALEGSKSFFKSICDKYNIPTAKYKTFTEPSAAKQYIKKKGPPIVVKTHGLAAGKGAIVAMTLEEAYDAVDLMLVEEAFGSGGSKLIVEEFLEGDEVSFYALVDGETAIPMASVQDHKRVGDGDMGPNTGGMGAYSPAPVLTPELQLFVMKSIILPTVKGMAAEGCKFVGVLGAGLIIEKKSGFPKLIEYDVRFGDPEFQVLAVRLKSDLAQVLLAACIGKLSGVTLDWSPEPAMVVIMASMGYPGAYKAGSVIQNLEAAEMVAPSVNIFHGGTAFDSDGKLIAVSGRVLGVTAKGRNLEEARKRAYNAVEAIDWLGGFYRHDIGWRALPKTQVEKEG